jgi:hypothetical protein
MARHNMVNGVKVMFTPEEETARDEEEATELAKEPMFNWRRAMAKTDSNMPRFAEDILEGMSDKTGVAQITLDRLQSKKDLRATKP